MKIMTATQECIDQKKTDHFNDLFHTYFHKNLFFIRNDLTNKEEVIRFMGQQFIDQDITSNCFIESVLQKEKLSSTGFFGTFAIPHAMELNAKRTMYSVLLSPKEILWDDKKVYIVLMIAVQKKIETNSWNCMKPSYTP